jgi:hypothetical protein
VSSYTHSHPLTDEYIRIYMYANIHTHIHITNAALSLTLVLPRSLTPGSKGSAAMRVLMKESLAASAKDDGDESDSSSSAGRGSGPSRRDGRSVPVGHSPESRETQLEDSRGL